jgi:2-polyprenyl-6-methoxyphenol hydroxylase-like FAD-dependent oxidoreductase
VFECVCNWKEQAHRALEEEYLMMGAEVQKKVVVVQDQMNEVKKQLIRSVKRLNVEAKRLKKAVDGRCIFLVNNVPGSSLLNGGLNEALADVSSLVWRLAMSEDCSQLLEMYSRERLYAEEVRMTRNECLLHYCAPGMTSELQLACSRTGSRSASSQCLCRLLQ